MLFAALVIVYSAIAYAREFDDSTSFDGYFIKREGDILMVNRTRIPGMKSSALRDRDSKWKYGEVPVWFSPAFTVWEKRKIIDAMLEIHNQTCVRFRFATDDDHDFIGIVKPRQSECASMVGRQGGPQVLYLSPGCFSRKVILHELMHALGFIHEHNRSDRDKYVTVHWSNILEGEEHNFEKRKSRSLSLMDTEYAYDSIMHYEGTEFSYNRRSSTIEPKQRILTMGGGEHLSPIDVIRINKYYSCPILGEEVELAEELTTTMETATTTEAATTVRPTITIDLPTTIKTHQIFTTNRPIPRNRLMTTEHPPIHWLKKDCPNPYDIPKENGNCRWMIMKVVADSHSLYHYLHCVPSLRTSDIRCGIWRRKQCSSRTIFDSTLKSCRDIHSVTSNNDDDYDLY